MGKKNKKQEVKIAKEDIPSESDSMEDSEEEITFNPMTKEDRKRQAEMLHDFDDEGEDQQDDDDGDEDSDDDMINVEFEFSDPRESHFKSVRNFFRYLFMGTAKDIDFSPLADAVVSQVEAGSMIQVAGEDDVYAFLTMLNLQFYKVVFQSFFQLQDNKSIQAILSILRKNCPEELLPKFEEAIAKPTGLLLNERMRNFPPEVIPNLFNSLGEDIKWALENSDTKEAFKYDNMLVIAPCFYEEVEIRKKGKKQKLSKEQGNCLFFHFEDEILQKVRISRRYDS